MLKILPKFQLCSIQINPIFSEGKTCHYLMEPQSSWKLLTNIPITNHADFVVLYDNICYSLFAIKNKIGLLKYSFNTDSWTKYQIKTSLNKSLFKCLSDCAAAINCKTKTIYLFNKPYSIIKLQIMNNNETKMEEIIIKTPQIKIPFVGSNAINIKDECHIIGGYQNHNKHIKYNTKTQKCQIIHDFKSPFDLNVIYLHKLIKIQNKLLIFGGFDGKNCLDTVYQYDMITNKWNKLNCKIPKPLCSFGCTAILNGQYVLLIGGYDDGFGYQDNIYFYCVRDQKFKKSTIKCPDIGQYQAITVNDKKKDTLTTFGFVRCKWKECKISDHLFPPQYLITIICGYYLNEFVHLFNIGNGKHYRINVFDIIDIVKSQITFSV